MEYAERNIDVIIDFQKRQLGNLSQYREWICSRQYSFDSSLV